MVYCVFTALVTFFIRRFSHFKGRLIREIYAKLIKIYSDFGGRLICVDIQNIFFTNQAKKLRNYFVYQLFQNGTFNC